MITKSTIDNRFLFKKRLRKCSKCKKIKPFDFFSKSPISSNGLHSSCKDCNNKYNRNNYHKNIEKSRERGRKKYYKADKNIHYRMAGWKGNAKTRGLRWGLTEQYLDSLPKICFYTKIPLVFETHKPNTISLDRIDSSKGYVPGNVVFCCYMINSMKMEYGLEQFVEMCKLVSDNRKNILQRRIWK